MLKNPSSTRKLTLAAMLLAVSVVLSQFFRIELPIGGITGLKIGLAQLPVLFGSIVLGPTYGLLLAVASDFFSVLMSSSGAYQPLFAVTAAIFGFLPGLFLHRRPARPGFIRLFIVLLLTQMVTSAALNTLLIHVLYGVPLLSLLVTRLPAAVIDSIVLSALCSMLLYLGERYKFIVYPSATK